MQPRQPVGRSLKQPGQPAQLWQQLFSCGARGYGCEAKVTMAQGNTVLDTRSDVFNVSDNVWKVALGASGISIMGMSGYCSPASLENDLRICRENYANWWEKMFWPPDDWGDMTPDRDEWISGQSARWESAKNIKAFIAMAKPQGIKSITYGKHGTGGPEGWELTRKHPEWFYTDEQGHVVGSFNTWDLANWHDIKLHLDPEGRKQFASDWWGSMPDFRQKEPLEWGLKEMIESSKMLGWDGVRFDGHWTAGNDELSTQNMKRLKEALWAYDPHYVFGFNQSWSYGLQTSSTAGGMVGGYDHELRESLAGGGMYMQEAIGQWGYGSASLQRYTSWKDYATKELIAANGVRGLGGSYHFIYGSWNLNPTDRLYKFALGTADGIHPVYGDHLGMPGCPNWGRFLTRWSAFVWDLNLKPLSAPGTLDVRSARPIWWREWAKERVADAGTRHVIVHLINPPADDTIGKNNNLLAPPAVDVKVAAEVPPGQKLTRVFLLDPSSDAQAGPLETAVVEGWARVTVPKVTLWSMVVFEFSGTFPVPPSRPRFSEPVDLAKAEAGRKGAGKPLGFDPLKPAEAVGSSMKRWVFETNSGFNSVPARGIADPEAGDGMAQVRDTGEKSVYVGRTWMGPLPAGKYVAHLRIKLEDKANPPRRQHLQMRLLIHGIIDTNLDFGTPEANYPPERTFIMDNKYHDYDIAIECPKDGLAPCLIGGASTPDEGDQRFLLDRIVIDQVERYTDARQAETVKMEAPASLKPGGAPGLDILVVKGWTWDTYGLGSVLPALAGADRVVSLWSNTGEALNFPQKYEDLYKFDVVVLCNVGAFGLQYEGRKILKDFVEAGGGLVVLGSSYTLGQGNMAQTYFEDLLPVQVTDKRDVQQAAAPLPLKPGQGPLLDGVPIAAWKQAPVLYWRHVITPKAAANVALYADKEPVLITSQIGQGRVAVFTGTVLGDKQGADLPFWQWQGWPVILGNTVRWAGRQ